MKIAVIGPESSGKTVLSERLAKYFELSLIPEFSRTYLDNLGRVYREEDLFEIAIGQHKSISKLDSEASLISDTEVMTIKIWAMEKYGSCDERINDLLNDQKIDLYLLCYPDLEWKFDVLRESPDLQDRERIFKHFKNELQSMKVDFDVIKGLGEERLKRAVLAVSKRFR